MTLGTAVLLLAAAVTGIVLCCRHLHDKRRIRNICIVLLSLIALACMVYLGLIAVFLWAIQSQPPAQ